MKFLVPIDGSKVGIKVLKEARKLGEKFEAELLLLTVVDDLNLKYSHTYPDYHDVLVEKAREDLEDVAAECKDYQYGVRKFVKAGMPYNEILKLGDEENVDLIVMGNRGLGAFSRTLLGSVSSKVLNHSKKSVLIIKSDFED
ncbi:universal stress protein [Anaerosphaera multitolerans]|uniref:Universal stress protein n=1 Tax=Anaerosphaera multitolerans TaxID=2487351 RepID=A0A437S4C8_9FIRM|nr:universal stress protein [Anaerosphaera multitolerans]RVU53806.1 universal stress protein [Anaerosphaera multitolerans]